MHTLFFCETIFTLETDASTELPNLVRYITVNTAPRGFDWDGLKWNTPWRSNTRLTIWNSLHLFWIQLRVFQKRFSTSHRLPCPWKLLILILNRRMPTQFHPRRKVDGLMFPAMTSYGHLLHHAFCMIQLLSNQLLVRFSNWSSNDGVCEIKNRVT